MDFSSTSLRQKRQQQVEKSLEQFKEIVLHPSIDTSDSILSTIDKNQTSSQNNLLSGSTVLEYYEEDEGAHSMHPMFSNSSTPQSFNSSVELNQPEGVPDSELQSSQLVLKKRRTSLYKRQASNALSSGRGISNALVQNNKVKKKKRQPRFVSSSDSNESSGCRSDGSEGVDNELEWGDFSSLNDTDQEEDLEKEDPETDDADDISDIDDILLGADNSFRHTIQKAADEGNDAAFKWLSRKRKRHRSRRKERRLFTGTRKTRNKRRTAAMESEMTPKVEELMRNANDAYLEKHFLQAVSFLEDAIKEAPGLHDPFHLLGLIYEEELNEPRKALDCYLLAAHLLPDDYHLWNRVAVMSKEQGHLRQAIYGYKKELKAIRLADRPLNERSLFDLSECLMLNKDYSQATSQLEILFERYPQDPILGQNLAKCYHYQGQIESSINVLIQCSSSRILSTELNNIRKDYPLLLTSVQNTDESMITVYHPYLTNMLADLYVESNRYQECEILLLNIINEDIIDSASLDLLVKLGTSQIYLGKISSIYAIRAYKLLLESPIVQEKFVDLYLLLAHAFFQIPDPEKALQLFTAIAHLPSVRQDASVWVKIARCQLQLTGQTTTQSQDLSRCIFQPDSTAKASIVRNLKGDSTARLMLSQVLTKLGHSNDSGYFVVSMASGDTKTNFFEELPDPLPHEARLQIFQKLQNELSIILPICSKTTLLTDIEKKQRDEWIFEFLEIVQHSELDTQRVLRYNFQRRLGRVKLDNESQRQLLQELGVSDVIEQEPPPCSSIDDELKTIENQQDDIMQYCNQEEILQEGSIMRGIHDTPYEKNKQRSFGQAINHSNLQYARVKQNLGLAPLEDILGWKDYGFFLETGIGIVMRSAGMYRAGVELCEAILANKRSIRSQQFDLQRRQFQQTLKKISLQMALEGGLYRIALSYIREKYLHRPDASNRAVQAFGHILFCGTFAHATIGGLSSSIEKEALLENRAWCIRQLLQRPLSYPLTLLTGHFCSLSGRWPLAVAEYTRAHQLVPRDDLTALSLATSLLNFVTSRSVQDRHAVVLRGFAMLATYKELRQKTMTLMLRSLKTQHTIYLDHHSELKGDALLYVQHMLQTLRIITLMAYTAEIQYNLARACHHLNIVHLAVPTYIHCMTLLNFVSSINSFLKSVKEHCPNLPIPAIITFDSAQLRFCTMHNLSLIYRSCHVMTLAREYAMNSMIWDDNQ